MVFGLSYHPEAGHDYAEAGGATNAQASPLSSPRAPTPSWSPPPNPPCPPTIDEVLQNSVRGFREPWWKTSCSSYAADQDEDALRADEAEGCCFGGIGGCDMPPETKVGGAQRVRSGVWRVAGYYFGFVYSNGNRTIS